MSFRTLITGFVIVTMLAVLSECGDRWKDYNYKMTIYAGGRSYSAVRHVEIEEVPTILDSSGSRIARRSEGEAVVIDTPKGPVFALMTPIDGQFGFGRYAAYVTEPALVPATQESEIDRVARGYRGDPSPPVWAVGGKASRHNAMVRVKGPHDLPRTVPNPDLYRGPRDTAIWPKFVRFRDTKDPASIEEVDPGSIGVSRITIEITHDDISKQVEKILPTEFWKRWGNYHKLQIQKPGGAMDNPYFQTWQSQISRGDFIQENL